MHSVDYGFALLNSNLAFHALEAHPFVSFSPQTGTIWILPTLNATLTHLALPTKAGTKFLYHNNARKKLPPQWSIWDQKGTTLRKPTASDLS